ncbi:MAG: oligosaccharide flippase family protein [Thermoplasmata archaeon]
MIARRSVLVFTANILGGLLGYIGLFAIARFTPNSEELLGLVGFGLGFVGSIFVLTGLGVPVAHIKRISQGEPLAECIGAFTLLKILQVGLATGVTFLALYMWTDVLGRGFETPVHVRVVLVMLVYHIALSVANVGIVTFSARLEMAKSQTSFLIGTATRVLGMIIVAVAALGALALTWAYTLGAVAIAIPTLLLLRHYPIARPRIGLIRSYLKFALPLSLPAVLIGLSVNIDKAVIQLFWGAAEVGYYFTVQRVILLLTVITSAVSLLLFPTISRYHARNELDLLRKKSEQAERYLSMILAPIVAFILVYSEGSIHVMLSDNFLPAANILRLFALATFVLALIVPRRAILQGMGRPDLAGVASLIGALTTLALYLVLIPTSIFGVPLAGMGGEGAAAGVFIGYTVLLGSSLVFSHKLVGDRPHGRIALHIGAAAAVALFFFLFLPPVSSLDWRWFHLLLFGGAFIGAYIALLTALREFRKADLLLFLDLINPKKMLRYVRDEMKNDDIG